MMAAMPIMVKTLKNILLQINDLETWVCSIVDASTSSAQIMALGWP